MLTLADILEALTGYRPGKPTQVITDAVVDSRRAIPGSIFFAIPGQRLDGHDFVEDAFDRGASIAIIQHEVAEYFPVLDIRTEWQTESLDERSLSSFLNH